jgi:magnesium transporter
MTPHVLTMSRDLLAAEALEMLRHRLQQDRSFVYIYAVDDAQRLAGVLSMRDLLLAMPQRPLSQIMKRDIELLTPDVDQEEVARRIRRNRHAALPVVDADRRLLGAVTADAVMHVMEEEATEDTLRIAGAGTDELLTSPWHFSFRRRLPWLLANLGLAAGTASIVALFRGTIEAWVVLAVYLPVIAGMGGNASAQAMAVAIRGIATGDADDVRLRRVIRREFVVGAAIGTLTGTIAAGVCLFLHPDEPMVLPVIVGVALLLNQTLACMWGSIVPFAMRRLRTDPAQSASIFTTNAIDLVGAFLLLGLATLVLRYLN